MNNKTMKKNIVISTIEKAKNIAIFWHKSPDGDCIWSMLWLGWLLEKQKKTVSYFVPSKPGKMFDFLPDIKKIKTIFDYKNYDLLIFLDITNYNRIEAFTKNHEEYFDKKELLIIDHHPEIKAPEHAKIIRDIHASSTTALILEATKTKWEHFYDKDIASYLYVWLITDTGNFLYEEDSIRTFTNAITLIKLWADKPTITNKIFRRKTIQSVQFSQLLLWRMKKEWDILYTYYQEKELKKYDIDEEQAGWAMYTMQDIEWPKLIILIKEIKNEIKFSLRWRWKVDCNKIAKWFWWWWHKNAAGFSIQKTWSFLQTINKIVKKINNDNK